jgi:hypothetical protein
MPIFETNAVMNAVPYDPRHLVPMGWVEEYVGGMVKPPVRVASDVNLAGTYAPADKTLTLSANGALVVDGVALAQYDYVLLVGQTDKTQNGKYYVEVIGDAVTPAALIRATDFDESREISSGVRIGVHEGDTYADKEFRLATDGPVTLDTTELTFSVVVPVNIVRKHAETITGDGTVDTFMVTHGLGTEDVSVMVYDENGGDQVFTGLHRELNYVALIFETAPANGKTYKVVVMG